MKKKPNTTNCKLLKDYIKKSGYSITDVAKQIGITYVALNAKLKGEYAFTLDEALQLKKILKLTQVQWDAIFNKGA